MSFSILTAKLGDKLVARSSFFFLAVGKCTVRTVDLREVRTGSVKNMARMKKMTSLFVFFRAGT